MITKFLWLFPLFTYAADANAWGLFTHIYFAQYLSFAIPLLDPKLRNAIQKFPDLVMAGACIPDLALVSKSFKTTHQWSKSKELLTNVKTDEELALAIGFTSHLFVDVLAHNHFVPAFEAKWLNKSIVTHIVAEWAMDAHIKQRIKMRPYGLLKQHQVVISRFIATRFNESEANTTKAINKLAMADKTLRFSQLASILLSSIKLRDDEFVLKLNYYLHKTEEALHAFEEALKGKTPKMEAELLNLSATDMHQWREKCLIDARLRLTTPLAFDLKHHDQIQAHHP